MAVIPSPGEGATGGGDACPSLKTVPVFWRSVGCGRSTVSLRRGAKTGEGAAAGVELRTGLKKSFLLLRRQTDQVHLSGSCFTFHK